MILPGCLVPISYFFWGQYRTIVDAVAFAGDAVRAGTWALAFQSLHVLIPVGLGVGVGVVGVSNLMKMLLANYQRAHSDFYWGTCWRCDWVVAVYAVGSATARRRRAWRGTPHA
ncbi:MAG: hypothetical protein CM1200mP25_0300 [Acidobacteriota bacterium]|nr:MAG: hypothetical protein CM1200mP25_0300 [Acidobacteriota bacterium]